MPSDLFGYHKAKVTTDEDCDHGPCTIYTLTDGRWIEVYSERQGLISIHEA